jgi:hypothetical protein
MIDLVDKVITHVVHEFRVGDSEDPDLYAADPISQWEHSAAGKWIMKNSKPVASWHRRLDHLTYGHRYEIRAYLTPKQLTYFELKFK